MNRIDELGQLRLRYVQVLSFAGIIFSLVALVPILVLGRYSVVPLVLFGVLNCVWFWFVSRRRFRLASFGMLTTFLVATLVVPFDLFLVPALLALVTAAILASNRVYTLANLVVLAKLAFTTLQAVQASGGSIPADLNGYILMMIGLVFVSVAVRYFINVGHEIISSSRISADLLQATSDVGQVLSQILDMDDMLARAVELIVARFNHYHVQIFMVSDSRDQALLVASTGDVGRRLLSRGHQLSIGSQSVIGQVVLRGAPVLVSDTHQEAIYYANELLQDTRAELALPIREGNQTIGALDIQSMHANAFGKADLQALQIMADLLATAIRNARLFRQQGQTLRDNDRLYRDAETNLREIQRLNQQLTRSAWQEYQSDTRAVTGITLERDRLTSGNEWSESLTRAGQEGQIISGGSTPGTVAVPVILRGEVIGAIEVEAGTETSPETIEMMQAVAQRLALSLENARLYEATLEAAAQEQRINDIAARFQSVATVDELLRITLSELSETLGAESGSIRLGDFTKLSDLVQSNGNSPHD
ncbi:MAG: GAF domain-containing protein [Chloroflexota bacterium]